MSRYLRHLVGLFSALSLTAAAVIGLDADAWFLLVLSLAVANVVAWTTYREAGSSDSDRDAVSPQMPVSSLASGTSSPVPACQPSGDNELLKDVSQGMVAMAKSLLAQSDSDPAPELVSLFAAARYLDLKLSGEDVRTATLTDEPLVVSELVGEVCEMLAPIADAKRVRIDNQVSIAMRAPSRGSKLLLAHTLLESIDHILRHTPKGRVVVRPEWTASGELTVRLGECHAFDAHEAHARIAAPLRRHGGSLSFETATKQIRLSFPVHLAGTAARLGGRDKNLGRKVIVAGDPSYSSPGWQQLCEMSDQIADWGFAVEHVTSISEAFSRALRALQEDGASPSVIFFQPGLTETRRELLDIARSHEGLSRAPFVLVRERDGHGDWRRKYLDAGFDLVIETPADRQTLFEFLRGEAAVPTEEPGVASIAAYRRAREPASGLQILLATEDGWGQTALTLMLRRAGNEVTVVGLADEVFRVLESHKFDLGIFSTSMPLLSGSESSSTAFLTRALAKEMPLLLLGERIAPPDQELLDKAHADGFILTPCEPSQLLDAIDDVLAARRDFRAMTAAPPPTHQPIVDRGALDNLHALAFDNAFILDVVDSYLQEAAELRDEMLAARAKADWESFQRAALFLKGASSSVGAKTLAEQCRAMADEPLESAPDRVEDFLKDFEASYRDTVEAIKLYRKDVVGSSSAS